MLNLDALRALGIDTGEGMACCADDAEFYEEMLGEFVNDSAARSGELAACFAGRDWERYRICIHAAKSTARMIGAEAISEQARKLEHAAAEKDEPALLSAHAGFLRDYADLTEQLRAALA